MMEEHNMKSNEIKALRTLDQKVLEDRINAGEWHGAELTIARKVLSDLRNDTPAPVVAATVPDVTAPAVVGAPTDVTVPAAPAVVSTRHKPNETTHEVETLAGPGNGIRKGDTVLYPVANRAGSPMAEGRVTRVFTWVGDVNVAYGDGTVHREELKVIGADGRRCYRFGWQVVRLRDAAGNVYATAPTAITAPATVTAPVVDGTPTDVTAPAMDAPAMDAPAMDAPAMDAPAVGDGVTAVVPVVG